MIADTVSASENAIICINVVIVNQQMSGGAKIGCRYLELHVHYVLLQQEAVFLLLLQKRYDDHCSLRVGNHSRTLVKQQH